MVTPFLPFGNALMTEMKNAGFVSQRELARTCGDDPVYINRYCTGARIPTLIRFAAITRAGLDPIPLLAALDGLKDEETT